MRPDVKRCGACGARNRPHWRACQRCRQPLVDRPSGAKTPGAGDSRRAGSAAMRPALWAAGAVSAAVVVAVIALPGRTTTDAGAPLSKPPVLDSVASDLPLPAGQPEAALTPVTREDFARAGQAGYAQGRMDIALSAFEQAAAAFPDDADARNNLGQILTRVGRASEAVPHLEAAVGADPARWAFRFNLARARGMTGDWDRAVADYRAAADLFPGDHATLYNLGRALQKAGRDSEAIEPLEQAVALEPGESSFLLTLAASYERLSRLPDAVRTYRAFLDREPRAADGAAIRARIVRLEQVAQPSGPMTVTSAPPAS